MVRKLRLFLSFLTAGLCTGLFLIAVKPAFAQVGPPVAGSCNKAGYFNCQYISGPNGDKWTPNLDLGYNCQKGSIEEGQALELCRGASDTEAKDFDRFTKLYGTSFSGKDVVCLSCNKPLQVKKGYLDECDPAKDICTEGTCRDSVAYKKGKKLCLYPTSSQPFNGLCSVGENECAGKCKPSAQDLPGAPGICSNDAAIVPPAQNGEVKFDLCSQIPKDNPDGRQQCFDCQNGQGKFKEKGLWTAVGCIAIGENDNVANGVVKAVLQIGLSISGGVAILMILGGAGMLSLSQGDPKKAGAGKDWISSAAIGLLFIIFSIAILQFLGITILQIPGFGK